MLTNLFLGQTAEEKLYVEDVFSTWLYTGNGSSQTITNGIDLAGKGGLVWFKARTGGALDHALYDTARTNNARLITNTTAAQTTQYPEFTSFNSNGFTFYNNIDGGYINQSGISHVSWTFRKAPKFFDVVTYTGNGTTNFSKSISHSLGVRPGLVIVKNTTRTSNWMVWHPIMDGSAYNLQLNTTNASSSTNETNGRVYVSTTAPYNLIVASTGTGDDANRNGDSYVAYLFAHDTTADGVIQCGSWTHNGTSGNSINLGWEPQYLLYKRTNAATSWAVHDNMRGLGTTGGYWLAPNTSNAESGPVSSALSINATGFSVEGGFSTNNDTYIYLAIRRGPMRVPTDATKVFVPIARTGTGAATEITTNFAPDALWVKKRIAGSGSFYDKLRGPTRLLYPEETLAEADGGTTGITAFMNTAISIGGNSGNVNTSGQTYATFSFRRAPGFFDVVCYTGTGSARTVSHNLGVAPELMIVKRRDTTADWQVYFGQSGEYMVLNTTAGKTSSNTDRWNNTAPTSAVFSLGTNAVVNASGGTYVAYLFSSCPGISKIGGYTGNGSSQNIDCGFTNGARFVLVKRTTATGSWTVFDTARGIVSAADPLLLLNTTDAEATNDSIDPLSSGFTINQTSSTNLNITAATYIYLAIA